MARMQPLWLPAGRPGLGSANLCLHFHLEEPAGIDLQLRSGKPWLCIYGCLLLTGHVSASMLFDMYLLNARAGPRQCKPRMSCKSLKRCSLWQTFCCTPLVKACFTAATGDRRLVQRDLAADREPRQNCGAERSALQPGQDAGGCGEYHGAAQ